MLQLIVNCGHDAQARNNVVQVFRYSALLFGVFYGFSHQRTLTSNLRAAHAQQEYHHKEDLIKEAKAAWVEKQLPPEQRKKGDGGVYPRYTEVCGEQALTISSNYGSR